MSLQSSEKDFTFAAHHLTGWSKKTAAVMQEKWDRLGPEQRARVVWDTLLWSRPKVMEGLAGMGVDLCRWRCPPPATGNKDVQHLLRDAEYKQAEPLTGLAVRKLAFWMNVSPATQAALTQGGVPTGTEKFSFWAKSAADKTWLNSFRYACAADPEQMKAWAQAEVPVLMISAVYAYLEKATVASEALAKEVLVFGCNEDRIRKDVAAYYVKQPEKQARLEQLLADVHTIRLGNALPQVASDSTVRGPRF